MLRGITWGRVMANNKVWLRYDDNNMHSKCILKVLFHLEIQCFKDISVVRISYKISISFKTKRLHIEMSISR